VIRTTFLVVYLQQYFAGGGAGDNDVFNTNEIGRAKIPLGGKGGGGNGVNDATTNNLMNVIASTGGGGGSWGEGES
jgi:hypothetical protein